MPVHRRRLAQAWTVAAVVAFPVAALAAGSGTPPKPTSGAVVASDSAGAAWKSAAAASRSRVGPQPPADSSAAMALKSAAAASLSATGASGSGLDRSMTGSAAVAALVGQLAVGPGAAERALRQIAALNSVDPASAAFAAIARALGVPPDGLAAALHDVKRAVAGR